MTNPDAATDACFDLRWNMSVGDYERACLAKRRATRVIWFDRAFAAVMILAALIELIVWSFRAAIYLALAVVALTDLWGRAYRWLFVYRRHESAVGPTRLVVTPSALIDETAGTVQQWNWGFWKAMLHLPDRLILMSSTGGNVNLITVPRKGLSADESWDDVVRFIEARVPDHPRDPAPRTSTESVLG